MGRGDRHGRAARTWREVLRDAWADGWVLVGFVASLALLAVFVWVSRDVVETIIENERVFFAGLSATGVVFAAQWSIGRYRSIRSQQADSEQLIRATKDSELIAAMHERVASTIDNLDVEQMQQSDPSIGVLEAAMFRWHERLLRDYSIHRELAVLRRNLEAAYERANEYFDAQAEDEDFYLHAEQFNVIIRDINQACGNALIVDIALRDKRRPDLTPNTGLETIRLNKLGGILRDLTEALQRRDQVYESVFRYSNGDEALGRARENFRVMTSDLRKAQRTLEGLLDRDRFNVRIDELIMKGRLSAEVAGQRIIWQDYEEIHDYAIAAASRAREALEELARAEVAPRPMFLVLLNDVSSAADALAQNKPNLRRELNQDLTGLRPPRTSDPAETVA